jgi:hypothetical protein
MTKLIYRFSIDMRKAANNNGRITVDAPLGAYIVHVDVQQRPPHDPCMWVQLDPDLEPLKRTFEIVGTGHPAPEDGWHIATWQQSGFVWHLYELPLDEQEPARP